LATLRTLAHSFGPAVLLALALQGTPAPSTIPVAVYPVLGHGRDSVTAERVTASVVSAFRGESVLVLVSARPVRGSGMPVPKYGVVAELSRADGGSFTLSVRIVDILGVYLVARDSLSGPIADVERRLPALAGRVSDRLTTLQWPVFRAGPPPSWLVPTEALRSYAWALEAADRGDTAGAVRSLREALHILPNYREACNALRRFGEDPRCHR
jgi:hypothetical protein